MAGDTNSDCAIVCSAIASPLIAKFSIMRLHKSHKSETLWDVLKLSIKDR